MNKPTPPMHFIQRQTRTSELCHRRTDEAPIANLEVPLGLPGSSLHRRGKFRFLECRLAETVMRGLLALFAGLNVAASPTSVLSPNGVLELRLPNGEGGSGGESSRFEVRYRGRTLLEGQTGLAVQGINLLAGAIARAQEQRTAEATYTMPFGAANPIHDHYRELGLELEPLQGAVRKVQLQFRVYDDGVAFRFGIPKQAGVDSVEITDEPTWFRLQGDPLAWPLYRESYTTSHEGRYASERITRLENQRLMDLPLLVQYEDGVSVAFTEASLRNYAGLYLKAQRDADQRRLECDLSPLPGEAEVKVRARLPLWSPWRVMLMGADAGRLIESNLILNLNESSAIGDDSWLRMGKTTWYWWNGPYQEPVDFEVGLNWATTKHYIDFCARNNIAFHSIMSTPDEYPWYHQSQRGYAPGPDTDIRRPRAGFPMRRAVEYARSNGVGIRLWVHWKPLSEALEEAFAQYEAWGVQGLMVDFLDRDDQEMVRFAERVLQTAARHHLHIQFHGVWKPTGLQRTYPNLLNHEGVLNLEYSKWSTDCDPEHNVTVPFTRMLAGPMDYHLGGFRSVVRDQFEPRNLQPTVLGTRAHHLAMYVVYENPMPMVADAPTAYEGQPGFDFIRQVPVAWDETRFLAGRPGDYIAVARRKGKDWYVGAMTDWTPRELSLSLQFLPAGAYQVETWEDTEDPMDPNAVNRESRRMTAPLVLDLRLASGGGQAIRIHPAVR